MKIGQRLGSEDVYVQCIVMVSNYRMIENVVDKAGLSNSSFGLKYNIISIDYKGNQVFCFLFPVTEVCVRNLYSGKERIEGCFIRH